MNYGQRLPSYLADVPAWVQLAEAMDTVLGKMLQERTQKLANVRDVNNWHPKALAAKQGVAILDGSDRAYEGEVWNDPASRVRTAMMLGFNFFNIYTLDADTYDQFVKMAVQFYPEQGTNTWADFLGFATNSMIRVSPLWTQDYASFLAEGDPLIGTPVYEGGTWYPTSHVDVKINANFSNKVDLVDFYDLLKFAAPINLVFRDVTIEFTNVKIDDLQIAMAGYLDVIWGIWNRAPMQVTQGMAGFMFVEWGDTQTDVPGNSMIVTPTYYSTVINPDDAYMQNDYVADDSGNIFDI